MRHRHILANTHTQASPSRHQHSDMLRGVFGQTPSVAKKPEFEPPRSFSLKATALSGPYCIVSKMGMDWVISKTLSGVASLALGANPTLFLGQDSSCSRRLEWLPLYCGLWFSGAERCCVRGRVPRMKLALNGSPGGSRPSLDPGPGNFCSVPVELSPDSIAGSPLSAL